MKVSTGTVKVSLVWTLLHNELNGGAACFSTYKKNIRSLICRKSSSNVGGRSSNLDHYSTRFAEMLRNKLHVFYSLSLLLAVLL